MTPQPQEPRDSDRQMIINEAFLRASRYIDARYDALSNRLEVIEQRMTRLEGNQQQMMVLLLQMQQQQQAMQQQMQEQRTFQQTMFDTFKAFALDIQKQIADGFAAQAEQINYLAARIDRLERRDAAGDDPEHHE